MSVTAKFYKVKDDNRCLHKTLGTAVASKTVTIKGACSLLYPEIVLRYDEQIADCNYVELGTPFNRYYYMGAPIIGPGKRMSIPCSVDVLMSFQAEILNLSVNAYRIERETASKSSDYIGDDSLPCRVDPTIITKKCKYATADIEFTPFYDTHNRYVLTVVGGLKNDV